MYFKGEFETGNILEFTSATGVLEASIVKNGSYGGKNTDNTNFRKDLGAEFATLYISGYFRWTGTIGDDWFVILGDGSTTGQFALKTTTGSKLKMVVNGITYTGDVALSPNVWYKLEVRIFVDNSGGYVHVLVDGNTDILQTGIDTRTSTDTGVRYIKWQGTNSASVNCYVDILTVRDYQAIGIRVSKPGFDVFTCADKDTIFSSDLNTLKAFGSSNLAPLDTPYSHNLGYIPIHLFAGFLEAKPTRVGLVGQNTDDNNTYVVATTTQITNDNNDTFAAKALVYVFYDSL